VLPPACVLALAPVASAAVAAAAPQRLSGSRRRGGSGSRCRGDSGLALQQQRFRRPQTQCLRNFQAAGAQDLLVVAVE
jgi:hypothetical protein